MSQIPLIAVPGQLLGPSSEYLPGPGTHIHASNLYASILGPIKTIAPPKPSYPQKRATKITPAAPVPLSTISIERATITGDKAEILPEVNSTVLCRVTRITPRQATVAILVVGETVLEGEWQGLIRVQDVRATEKDKVKIFESFRPGDIVRAVVISLGDQQSYFLSTARNELGVIMATSESGNAMYPVSWKEYKDPETGASESRKVAKPF
ncbi:exosome 3'-_5 exonuclease subunit ski4 (Csl4) [Ciborinia camelliae]|nr:exosome 3'->5 exonuclease subunit ski4 (Csl4) [Ciborinia camelliae]